MTIEPAPQDIGQYTEEERQAALRANGRRVRFRYELLSKEGESKGYLSNVQPGGQIAYNWLADVKRTGKFTLVEDEGFDAIAFLQDQIKPYFQLLMPDGLWASWPLGVMLLDSPQRQSNDGRVLHSVAAYDRGKILRQETLTKRFRLAKGANVVEAVQDILDDRNLPNDIVAHSGELAEERSWDLGTELYVVINELLDTINYASLFFDRVGTAIARPYVEPGERPHTVEYLTDAFSVVTEDATEELDLFDVPNQWVISVSQPDRPPLVGIQENRDPDSPTSIPARGRVVTRQVQENEDAITQANLNDRARRLAVEGAQVFHHINFSTILNPEHGENEIVHLRHDPLELDHNWSETEWEMTLEAGSLMTHGARRTFSLLGDTDPLATAAVDVEPVANKPAGNNVAFTGNPGHPLPPVRLLVQPITTVPWVTAKMWSFNGESVVGVHANLYRTNTTTTTLQVLAVGELDEDANMARGSEFIEPTKNAVTSVPITFGKTLTGTVRVFVSYGGGYPGTRVDNVRVGNITSTGADIRIVATSTAKRTVQWFAIGDSDLADHIAAGTVNVDATGSVANSAIVFGKSLPDPVRVFTTFVSNSTQHKQSSVSSITNTGATIYGYGEGGGTFPVQWLAIGGLG